MKAEQIGGIAMRAEWGGPERATALRKLNREEADADSDQILSPRLTGLRETSC